MYYTQSTHVSHQRLSVQKKISKKLGVMFKCPFFKRERHELSCCLPTTLAGSLPSTAACPAVPVSEPCPGRPPEPRTRRVRGRVAPTAGTRQLPACCTASRPGSVLRKWPDRTSSFGSFVAAICYVVLVKCVEM